MLKTTIASAVLGLALAATPAAAGKYEAQSMNVEYADLNLSTVEGQERLERRIDAAARSVCRLGEHRTGTHIPSQERKECFAKARASAKAQMASIMAKQRRGG